MSRCKPLYYLLFHAITDALEALGHLDIPAANQLLEEAQVKAEEMILDSE